MALQKPVVEQTLGSKPKRKQSIRLEEMAEMCRPDEYTPDQAKIRKTANNNIASASSDSCPNVGNNNEHQLFNASASSPSDLFLCSSRLSDGVSDSNRPDNSRNLPPHPSSGDHIFR